MRVVHVLEAAITEPLGILPTGKRIGTGLAQHRSDAQSHARPHVRPWQTANGDVLAGVARRKWVALGGERLDHLRAPQAQCLPWPSVVDAVGLHITGNAAEVDVDTGNGQFGYSATGGEQPDHLAGRRAGQLAGGTQRWPRRLQRAPHHGQVDVHVSGDVGPQWLDVGCIAGVGEQRPQDVDLLDGAAGIVFAETVGADRAHGAHRRLRLVTDTVDIADLKLTEWTSCGGCAAKWGAALLRDLVVEMPVGADPALLVGLAPFDDAAVYEVAPGVALVSTTDFFPPLVDHPSDFGAIAAANACSDVFAMGGRVVMAINVAAFPEHFPREAIAAIFQAAAEVVVEAGGSIAGGHTIRNPEPIFGLAVQGVVDPARVFRKGGAQPGDVLVLSKPLGTGLALAAGSDDDKSAAIAGMRRLNRVASEQLQVLGDAVHAVTDVTGYGLAGHGWEVAERSAVRVVVHTDGIVTYPGAGEAAERGVRTGGDARNRDYLDGHLESTATTRGEALCFDPQTSGGLLAAVDPAVADGLLGAGFWRVGVVEAGDALLVLR